MRYQCNDCWREDGLFLIEDRGPYESSSYLCAKCMVDSSNAEIKALTERLKALEAKVAELSKIATSP